MLTTYTCTTSCPFVLLQPNSSPPYLGLLSSKYGEVFITVRVCTGARGGARAGTQVQGGGERLRTRPRDCLSFTTDHTHVVLSVYRLVFVSHPPSLCRE
ncbi:hypothetical protein RSOLAG1IB_06802 [Rhizoctonia solani AG-1 IB]|uniref:Uncharacterized protein n=1 Tax=Thanatephorus cucumeris (strain AG1-IB / isolate 7/3/14) TaxID=1108050 RepID=A0A0B7FD25_THACB|nr:hypothetical protein RSOLAG1IB_06802 [Rhizoctonia solani AG-1 IB]